MLSHQQYRNSIIIGGIIFSIIALFGIVGSFLIQTILHYSAAQFGKITFGMGLAWFMGAMMNRFTLKVPFRLKANICFWSMFLTSAAMIYAEILHPLVIYNITIPMFLLFFFSGMMYPSYFIRSVLFFRESSASANALFNSSAFFISGVISGLGTFIHLDTALPFMGCVWVLMSLCLLFHNLDSPRHTESIFI